MEIEWCAVLLSSYRVKDIVGYEPEDLIGDGNTLVDFFHPADYKRMVPCEKFCKSIKILWIDEQLKLACGTSVLCMLMGYYVYERLDENKHHGRKSMQFPYIGTSIFRAEFMNSTKNRTSSHL